ncbi:MAG: DUF4231 domain-containing protein [Methanoregula sp.]|nr:DUF4231 domain-containing protein [Methanoregula sp.]
MTDTHDEFIIKRVDDQINYFDSKAIENQKNYRRIKTLSITCNVLTTFIIALAFTVPENFKIWMGIVALTLSTTVLATYQWEEFQNYGSKWEKFRLVAEQLKSEKCLYLNSAGRYSCDELSLNHKLFVETVESMIKGTDIAYFTLLVEPGKRIEKRLEYSEKK